MVRFKAVPEDADGSPYIQSKDLETEPYPDFPSLGVWEGPFFKCSSLWSLYFMQMTSEVQHPAIFSLRRSIDLVRSTASKTERPIEEAG